ncbi:hypothetical protein [Rhodococcus koreensis]
MRGVSTEVDKDTDTALVEVLDEKVRATVLSKLLDAAGDNKRQIKILTGGRTQQYRVPLALAKKAGVVDRTAAKAAPKKAADKTPPTNTIDDHSHGDGVNADDSKGPPPEEADSK